MYILLSFFGLPLDPNSLVYYIRLAVTVFLFGIFCKLGFDSVVFGLQVITGMVEKKPAMRRAFEIFLPFFLILFAMVVLWMDFSNSDIFTFSLLLILVASVAFVFAFFSALIVYWSCPK
ncbi:MAG: hypothetical protein CVU44_12305 [Chloroflexi bacterium HGW-Chloroflexi-6]|nr:MAG: hypothetical protein CVU44_12305 [Chloroflexi bacterium HGW-Chloroflexi-6]